MNREPAYTPDYVDIYRIRLDLDGTGTAAYTKWLSADERARTDKFLSAVKAKEFTITRGSLKKILAQTLGEDPANICIAHEEQGKPYLVCADRHAGIRFSVSHSHDLALIAITRDRAIGIDVEKIRNDIDHENLSRRFFSAVEYGALQNCSDATRLRAFFAVWTRKEAVVKAHGQGIALGLKQFDVSIDPDRPAQVLATRWEQTDMPDWTLLNLDVGQDYFASLAVSGGNVDFCYRELA